MSRRLRQLSNQGVYHAYNRAEGGAFILRKPAAKRLFIQALFDTVELHQWILYAYAVMDNHFHLVVSTPLGNLDKGMHALQSDFANKHKAFRQEVGHVFQSRYSASHFRLLASATKAFDYVHLNPVRAKVVSLEELDRYPWTSMRCLRHPKGRGCVSLGDALGYFHGLKDDADGWSAYVEKLRLSLIMDDRYMTDEELAGLVRKVRKGSLREARPRPMAVNQTREELLAAQKDGWTKVFYQVLAAEGLVGVDFSVMTKSDGRKVRVAAKVRKLCPATSVWLAERLFTGSASNLRRLMAATKGSTD